ncbi:MAG: DNA polymerase III subunit delta [Rhodospirillaceae bacterium]|nr:DNA polymerase III subunit delta [Rhodospirillaceae bacterium]MBT6509107.1 DNA polymerase III subunit delta [Rhodospirillaceae bacterium]MBT7647457.1 DNA polymerase III subunit delta [Rhodospirillaceae bacterium]
MKIAARQADSFCRAPSGETRAVLVYGPDNGLVRERADLLVASAVDDPSDPFRVAELVGDAIAGDGALLVDEAGAISLVGGRRVVRVKGGGDKLTDAVKDLLARPTGDTLIVIEAGELPGRSKLRALLEKAGDGAAVACYRDEGRDVSGVVTDELQRHGVRADRDALALMTAYLGGDRRQTRAETAKLALYVGEGGQATVADVEAVVADSSFLSMDRIAHAVAAGKLDELDRSLERALADREQPVSILSAVRRHMTQLQLFLALKERGASEADALKATRVFHFRAADAIKAGGRRWSADRATRALGYINEAELQCKSTGMPADTICRRTLFDLARAAAGSGRR